MNNYFDNIEGVEFETADPTLRGKMTIATTLKDTDDGTDVRKLAAFAENGWTSNEGDFFTKCVSC